jgi:aminoglycoside phosphotransferase (APT) family kinase protein
VPQDVVVDLAAAKAIALDVVGGSSATLTPDQGESSWTFVIDRALVVKVARSGDVSLRMRREVALLKVVAEHWPVAVPRASLAEVAGGVSVMFYPWIAGRPLTRSDLDGDAALTEVLLAAVDSLRDVPLVPVAEVLGTSASTTAWRDHHRQLWTSIIDTAGPHLPADLVARLQQVYLAAVEGDAAAITGVIDWEYALVGDPLQDQVALGYGREFVESGRAGPRVDATARLEYYAVFGPAAAAANGVRTRDEQLVRAVTQVLDRRAPR